MAEHAGGRSEHPEPDFLGKNRDQQAEASRLKKSNRSPDHGDDLDDSAAAGASCPPTRKRQRSRSRERARTGLWGDGQEQLLGRNGMGNGFVASHRHRSSSPLSPLPESTRSCSSDAAAAPPTRPSPPSKSAGEGGGASSDRLSLTEQVEVANNELGHREAFHSWRGYDDNLLNLMDEVMYEDCDDAFGMNDTPFNPSDKYGADCATDYVSSSSGGVIVEGGAGSEPCYVPCDPVADHVPIIATIDEEVDDKDTTKDP